MGKQVDVFFKHLLKSDASRVNISPRCRYLGFDVAAQLEFGYDFELQTDEANRFLTTGMTLGDWRINAGMQYPPLVKWSRRFPSRLRPKLRELIRTMIVSRMGEPADAKHDLLSAFNE
jgi:cytochrome P450